MKLVLKHADRFAFAVAGESSVSALDPATAATADASLGEVLVAFVAVESTDSADLDDVIAQAAEIVSERASVVGAERVVLYPYGQLLSQAAPGDVVTDILRRLQQALSRNDSLEVHRAPLGCLTSLEIACKRHPLAELARTVSPRSEPGMDADPAAHESQAVAAEKSLHSEWRIYRPDGTYESAEGFDFAAHSGMRKLYAYERSGSRAAEDAPPHIRLMKDHELVDYEPASDAGNMRWYPAGTLVKRLLERHVTGMVAEYGAMEVETPIMYDYSHPALSKYLDRFPARQYVVKSDEKEYFLRFAACFGQYMIAHDTAISYRHLPVRLYELTRYSFRREQAGEVSGLRRLRTFTMPDMHSLVRDMTMAKEEFLRQVALCIRWVDDLGLPCVPAIRLVRSFLDEHPAFLAELMRALGRPALIEVWDERFFYFVAKFELNFVDNADKAACLSTVQIDVENGERFDITYVAEDGGRQHPLLLHTSVSGSVDRNVYAILEHQAQRMATGHKAQWPTWLAPTQVRLLPVAQEHVAGAHELAEQIPFRADVDDRDIKIAKKVRDAETEWVPYTIVIGSRELAELGRLPVRLRKGERIEATLEELLARLDQETAGTPRLPSNTPRSLTKRPIFAG